MYTNIDSNHLITLLWSWIYHTSPGFQAIYIALELLIKVSSNKVLQTSIFILKVTYKNL